MFLKPGLTGFRGPFAGYVIPADERVWPHQDIANVNGGASLNDSVNALYYDGHADYRKTR